MNKTTNKNTIKNSHFASKSVGEIIASETGQIDQAGFVLPPSRHSIDEFVSISRIHHFVPRTLSVENKL
jgi:hypothetical protein